MLNSAVKISIKVQPNAARNQVIGRTNEIWRINIAAPPDKGKANKRLVEFLSGVLQIRKDHIFIVKGLASHHKIIAVEGLTQAEADNRLSKAE